MKAILKLDRIIRDSEGETLLLRAAPRKAEMNRLGWDDHVDIVRFTPQAELEIRVTNLNLIGTFEPGAIFQMELQPGFGDKSFSSKD